MSSLASFCKCSQRQAHANENVGAPRLSLFLMFVVFLCVALLTLPACKKSDAPTTLGINEISTLIQLRSRKSPRESDLWAKELNSSLDRLDLKASKENVCAVIAIIEQESSFNADPVVPGLAGILSQWIQKETSKPIIGHLINIRLDTKASDNRTFRQKINKIKTERDLEHWFREFTYDKWGGNSVLGLINKDIDHLISTLGSMQVSIFYARKFAKEKDIDKGDLREYLYTPEGGVFFGTAHLLNYNAKYPEWKFRFADYNSGQYSSRNAGFQEMLAKLSGMNISRDGDLLIYSNDEINTSESFDAAQKILTNSKEKISYDQLLDDFKLEKQSSFVDTRTYKAITDLHKSKYNFIVSQRIPVIKLQSDKLSKKRTTQWYANTVSYRFNQCVNAPVK